ncbi:hypothetical protein QTP88_000962 [Uroleucon formosanum]
MWRLVEVTVCLAKCGKPFRGHDESSHSFQKGFFKEFVELLSRYGYGVTKSFWKWPEKCIIYNLIRHAIFERIAKENGSKLHTLKSSSQTRWACRSEAVKAIKSNYNVLLEALEEITEKCLISEMKPKGKGILHQMKTFEFIFCLTMMQPTLEMILKVSAVLQTENLDLITAMSIVKPLKSSLSSIRSSTQDEEFHMVLKNCYNV